MIRSDLQTRIKFRRRCQPFRGGFPAGAFAAVFVLLLVFLAFDSPFVYLPGLPVQLGELSPPLGPGQTNVVKIEPPSVFRFQGKVWPDLASFEKRLRAEVQTNHNLRLLSVQPHPETPPELLNKVAALAGSLQLLVDFPGTRINFPIGQSLALATNRLVTVAINLSGQVYYEHQVIHPERLRAALAEAQRAAKRPLSLLVLADKAAPYEVLARVGDAARRAGIRDMILATRPPPFQLSPKP